MVHAHDDHAEGGAELSEMQIRVRALESIAKSKRTEPKSSVGRDTWPVGVDTVAARSATGSKGAGFTLRPTGAPEDIPNSCTARGRFAGCD